MAFFEHFKGKRQGVETASEDLPDLRAEPATLAEAAQQASAQHSTVRARAQDAGVGAEDDGLPSVNRRRGYNRLVTLLGFIFILGVAAALLVAVNQDPPTSQKKPSGPPEQVANHLPPIVVPPAPAPIALTNPAIVPTAAPPSAGGQPTPGQVPAIHPGSTTAQPIPLQANGKPLPDWTERKRGGALLVEARGLNASTLPGASAAHPGAAADTGEAVLLGAGSRASPGAQTELAARLEPTVTRGVSASLLPDRNFLLTKGSSLDCALETALDSSVPGMTTCRLTRDIYSDNGQVLLLDRGSQLVGEYQGGLRQGQARLFVLWSRAKTPKGVVVNLNSPGTDALGRSGLDGWVDQHFAERFGAAILFSLMKDTLAYAAAREHSAGGTIVYGNTQAAGEQIVGKVLDATINIPPTLVKNAGDHIQVMVARDLDFSGVYGLRIKQ